MSTILTNRSARLFNSIPVFLIFIIGGAWGAPSWAGAGVADRIAGVSETGSADSRSLLSQTGPVITVWYGLNQRVGHLGLPQDDFNLLGKVTATDGIASLAYSLNGAPSVDLTVGDDPNGFGDTRRLGRNGDFNADIPISSLLQGPNTIDLAAIDSLGVTTTETVIVNRETGDVPLPLDIDWTTVTNPQDVGKYVDGQWTQSPDGLRTVETGYDRLFLLGSRAWQDYDVRTRVTIHSVDAETGPNSQEPGIGLILRFAGHNGTDQPKWGFQPFGGLTWLRVRDDRESMDRQFFRGDIVVESNFGSVPYNPGVQYMIRARAETLEDAADGDGRTRYSLKVWLADTLEPSTWGFEYTQESASALRQGGVALVAHHVDATFGNIEVVSLGSDTFPPTLSGIQASVVETASVVSWTTSEPATSRVEYGTTTAYGSQVESTTLSSSHSLGLSGLTASTTYHYRVLSTDVSGNTATSSDRTFTTLDPGSASLVSDDFSDGFDTSLWSVVDPVGDGTVSATGTTVNLSVPAGSDHDVWTSGNRSLRVMQSVSGTDLEMEVKFESVPTEAYQVQGVVFEESPGEFLRFDFYTDGSDVRVFAANFTGGSPFVQYNQVLSSTSSGALWMRVGRSDDTWTQRVSVDGSTWTQAAQFSRPMALTQAGPFVANASGGSSPAHTAVVDYVFNTAAPISPEDDGATTDTTPPIISSVTAAAVETTASIDWTTDEAATSRVEYGATTAYGYQVESTGLTTSHALSLTGLTASTTYHYRVVSTDVAGNTATGVDQTFMTAEPINQAPTAVVAATPTSGTAPLAVAFDASGSTDADGTITGYAWDFGDGATGTGVAPSHTYQAAGSYTATVTVTDDGGATAEASVGITATGEPAALVSDDFSGGFDSSLWTTINPVGDGTLTATGTTLNLALPAGSDHDVWSGGNRSLRVMQSVSDTDFELEVKFESVPTAKYQLQGLIVEEAPGEFLRFDVYSTGSGINAFAADFAGGNPTVKHNGGLVGTPSGALWMRVARVGDTWTYSYSVDGSAWTQATQFSRALTVAQMGPFAGNATGSSSPAFTAVVDYFFDTAAPIDPEDGTAEPINQAPTAVVAATPTSGTAPLAVAFDASGSTDADGTITGYAWDFGDGATGTGVAPSHTYQAAGSYTATVTVTDDGGATAEASVGITATGEPAALVSDDFSGGFDSSLWTINDPAGDGAVSVNNGVLEIAVPAGSTHDLWSSNTDAVRVMQAASNGDLEVEVAFTSAVSQRYQIQGLLFEDGPGEMLRFDFYSDGRKVKVFAAGFQSGSPSALINKTIPVTGSPLHMRVQRLGDTWTQSWSNDGSTWTVAGQFDWVLALSQTGVFAGNAGSNPAHTAQVDAFTVLPPSPARTLASSNPLNKEAQSNVASGPFLEVAPLSARQAQGEVVLEWDSYLPVQSFELQQSAAGADFRTVRRFESEGTEGKAFQHVMHRVDPGTHEFRLVQTRTGGEVDIGEVFSVHVELFEPFLLHGVYPNPSSERAAIKLMTAEEEHVRIEVYNVLGQRVEIIHDSPVTPQEFRTIAIPTSRLPSGTYFLRVRGDSFHEMRQMVVVH